MLREFSAWQSDYGEFRGVFVHQNVSIHVLIARGTSLNLLRRTQCAFDVAVFFVSRSRSCSRHPRIFGVYSRLSFLVLTKLSLAVARGEIGCYMKYVDARS